MLTKFNLLGLTFLFIIAFAQSLFSPFVFSQTTTFIFEEQKKWMQQISFVIQHNRIIPRLNYLEEAEAEQLNKTCALAIYY